MISNKAENCFNCGEQLKNDENYCPNCGQKNTDLNISLRELSIDLAGDYFTFDSKFFRTLGPLIFKPGKVPKEYIDGKRVSHIPPLRVFIFLSFITFFLWGLSFNRDITKDENESSALDSSATFIDKISANQSNNDTIRILDAIDLTIGQDSSLNDSITNSGLSYAFNKENDPKEIIDSLAKDNSEFVKKVLYQSLRMYQAEGDEIQKYLMGNISIVLLLLQPFFALLLKLVYIRRKSFYYIEHLVFSLYFHAFILLSTIALFFISTYTNASSLIGWLILLSFLYLILAIKRFYMQSWLKSIFKSFLISFVYMILMFPVFIVAYLFLSVYFY